MSRSDDALVQLVKAHSYNSGLRETHPYELRMQLVISIMYAKVFMVRLILIILKGY